jgi:hypothetical protein
LIVKSTFYSIAVPLSAITAVQAIAPRSNADLLGMRVNGMGLPGFRSGWFAWKAADGRQRLFVDRAAGDFLLLFVDGQPRLALAFASNRSAARVLTAASTADSP